jgi:hypothetical protein
MAGKTTPVGGKLGKEAGGGTGIGHASHSFWATVPHKVSLFLKWGGPAPGSVAQGALKFLFRWTWFRYLLELTAHQ